MTKIPSSKQFKDAVTLVAFGFVLLPAVSLAAVLYLEPAQGEYYQGDIFIVEIRLNTEGEYINTVKGDLSFEQDILEVKDLSKGNSVLTLWVKTPAFSNQAGTISFIGGVPAGYQGWDGLLGRIIFEAKKEGEVEIKFQEDCQVLLNDGFGTPAQLTTKGAILTILPEKLEIPRDEWLGELEKDTIPPEAFDIAIQQDPAIFEGKYFIIFSTTDKQTGIDHFEVKEGEKDWQRGQSPYLLEDQSLEGIIKVKAVDKAGNERTVLVGPLRFPEKKFPYWIIILVLMGGAIIWWIVRKLKIKS